MTQSIHPQHINATPECMQGNNGVGCYIILTGSEERAKKISEHFNQLKVKKHPRQHNFYLGTIPDHQGSPIKVGAISTGMGGSSADIIINELLLVGAKRLLRVGTAASLQPDQIKVGDLVIATAAVRDDKASWDYIPKEYPAIASYEYITAISRASKRFNCRTHFGIVHSKSSLFAREYHYSLIDENQQYIRLMQKAGVAATEMECAQLFILSSLFGSYAHQAGLSCSIPIRSGAILAIVGDTKKPFAQDKQGVKKIIDEAILIGIESIRQMHLIDQQPGNCLDQQEHSTN